MTKLLKNSKSAFAFLIAFAIVAVSLFTGVAINADAATSTAKQTLYWNERSTSEPKTTDTDGNILITSAAEFAWLVANPDTDKSYKVKDDISTIVLQPKNAVDISKLMSYTNYSDVKTYFETNYTSSGNTDDTAHLFKWTALDSQDKAFKGTFDGNGVTIYGMYSVGSETGLFAWLAAGATVKNVAIKNSYSKSTDGAGAVFARLSNRVTTGMVNIENCEVSGCYVTTTSVNRERVGVIFGLGSANTGAPSYASLQIGVAMNKILVHDNYAITQQGDKCGLYGSVSSGYSGENTAQPNVNLFDSIIFDCLPYSIVQNNQASRLTYYGRVYTNEYDPTVGIPNAWYKPADYADKIFAIDETKLSEFTSTESCPSLDWMDTWILTEKGPQLRVFHNFESKQTENTHSFECTDCGLKQYGGAEDHSWSNGACQSCGYVCQHKSQTLETNEGDCVTQTTVKMHCNACGKEEVSKVGLAPAGHDLEWVENGADACGSTVKGYWYCKTCDKYFSGSDKTSVTFAKMKAAVSGPAKHKIVKVDEVAATDKMEGTKAHYECEVCHQMYLDAEGKTKALQADLVIAKATPSGFGALLGGKSPATGESIAVAVASVVALVCASFVILRKVKKFN